MTSEVILHYIGNGAYVAGIPATDLTEADIAASGFAVEQITKFHNNGNPLYVPVEAGNTPAVQPSVADSDEGDEVDNG